MFAGTLMLLICIVLLALVFFWINRKIATMMKLLLRPLLAALTEEAAYALQYTRHLSCACAIY